MDKYLKDDILAGFVVFLIALPLSIGIALAAGVPASAGILSAILGGIVATFITGTHIAISGPAAGLIVVISSATISLGDGDLVMGFKRTLAATMIAGILQVLMGTFKLGRITFLAPTAIVHGMLAAIGIIIVVKQVPVLLGVSAVSKSIPGLVLEIPELLMNSNYPIDAIGVICIILLIIWSYLPKKFVNIIPGPLIAVGIGLALSSYFVLGKAHSALFLGREFHLGPEFLVHVPSSLKDLFILPLFDKIFTLNSIVSTLTIFIVGSLESLLSAYAIDKLDPYQRKSNLDLDLIGKGITNIFCGALGAYPIITEIVRSSANISNGAKTKWANFYHGIFILIFVGFFPSVLNSIPLSALAAVLILVGINLAHPKQFVEIWHHGKDQFFLFMLTLVVTLVEDLLIGIAVGISAKIVLHLIRGVRPKEFYKPQIDLNIIESNILKVDVNSNLVFSVYLKIEEKFNHMTKKLEIQINKNDYFIDRTISEYLDEMVKENNKSGNIQTEHTSNKS